MASKADKSFDKKVKFILASIKRMDKAANKWQRDLYELLVSEYLPLFDITEDGKIANTAKNDRLIARVDNYVARLNKSLNRDILSGFAKDLLKSAQYSAEYYVNLGFKKTVTDRILNNKVKIEKRLGITPKGKVVKGSYLDRLAGSTQVADTLRNFVLTAVTSETNYLDFQLGFRNLVKGNKRVKGIAKQGVLQRYFDQYAYDTFNATDAVTNKTFAESLELKHFIYEGSIIKTSRKFCKKRAGKPYSVEEAKKWGDDPDLPKKVGGGVYDALVDRGLYRCRHFIKYITEATYIFLKTGKRAA